MPLIFVDCEAYGGCPALGKLTEFGAVHYPTRQSFHGVLIESRPSPANPAIPEPTGVEYDAKAVFTAFSTWLLRWSGKRSVFVSDNPAFDFQWINDGFLRHLGYNPFGHSARRISDFYAGLVGDFDQTQKWKRLRITKHDHHPVHDALGNLESFEKMQDILKQHLASGQFRPLPL